LEFGVPRTVGRKLLSERDENLIQRNQVLEYYMHVGRKLLSERDENFNPF